MAVDWDGEIEFARLRACWEYKKTPEEKFQDLDTVGLVCTAIGIVTFFVVVFA